MWTAGWETPDGHGWENSRDWQVGENGWAGQAVTDKSSTSLQMPPSTLEELADWNCSPYGASCSIQTPLQANLEKYHKKQTL